jgi:hypothetical protein
VAGVAASRPRVPNSVGVVVAVPGVVLQARGRPRRTNNGGDGAPAGLTSWLGLADSRGKGFEGAAGPPSRARRVSRTRVGSTVPRG